MAAGVSRKPAASTDGAAPRFDLRVAMATAFVATAALYLATMSRCVGFVDRGELAAVAATLGIAHPTGYPTLTVLGHLATLAWPGHPVLALNVFAALCVAAGVAVVVPLAVRIMRFAGAARPRRETPASAGSATAPRSETARILLATVMALLLATGSVWWQQALGFEAYALHALMLPLTLLTCLRWIESERATPASSAAPSAAVRRERVPGEATPSTPPPSPSRRALVFGLVLGLSLTNHMTTLVAGPALVGAAVIGLGFRRAMSRLPWIALGVVVGLVPYAYLPLRAAAHPRFDWGSVDTWHGFVSHLGGWQYRVWMFTSLDSFRRQLDFIAETLPAQSGYFGIAFALWGLVVLARRAARWAVALALLFACCVLYAANFEIRELDPYLLAAVLALGLAASAGLERLRTLAGSRVAIGMASTLVIVNVALNLRSSDEHALTLPRDLAINLLQGLPPHAVLLSSQWDHLVSPSYELQALEGVRRDVDVIDTELLRRIWYLDELSRRAPDLARGAGPAVDCFRRDVAPFELGRHYDSRAVQTSYRAMVDSLIRTSMAEGRPVFVTLEVDPSFASGATRVPYLLAKRLEWDDGYLPEPAPHWAFRPWRGRMDAYVTMTHRLYAEALVARAAYEAAHGNDSAAAAMMSSAQGFDPRIDVSRMPPMAMDGPQTVRDNADFFDRLRMARGVSPRP